MTNDDELFYGKSIDEILREFYKKVAENTLKD
jgi:hypothetical protein